MSQVTPRAPVTLDGNEAAASVAYRASEVIAIYPITPSSPMGEFADEWAAERRPNLWGTVPQVVEMQSEAGAAGAVHGALQAGALTTTFTASQGLLLMIPNMYKIAGELTAFAMHVSARTVATHALSIFGDHSDVMACRQIGFAMLASGSVQEAHDLACIAHAATLRSRVPFLHFFDGFRTSHEVAKIEMLSDDDLRAMLPDEAIRAHRERALTPDRPVLRGTAQNPDTFFQAREACNPFYLACPTLVQDIMDRFARLTGRQYHLFDYVGHPEAERIIVLMGSGAETAHETVEWMLASGEKVGVVKVRLYRPFAAADFVAALPPTVRAIAVLDRTKEPGALGEPLYLDVVAALREEGAGRFAAEPVVIGGRYGLASKEFTPAMVVAVFAELARTSPRRHFTVGITDDVTGLSLPVDAELDIEPDDVVRAVFFGLGADGTVGANKNSIKIIGEETPYYAQGYFVYDSKKSGAMTISHLRFGPRPIRSSYLIRRANFVACHQFPFMERYNVLDYAAPGAVFLLNAPYGPDEVWDHLARDVQAQIIEKRLRFYVINAVEIAQRTGMGGRINAIMQTCFFAISGVLPRDEAIAKIKEAIQKTYGRKGDEVVRRNWQAVDETLANLYEVRIPGRVTAEAPRRPLVPESAPDFVRRVTAAMMAGDGDRLPVSAFPPDGTWPVGTTRWEKRNIAHEIPVWDPAICIQCNKCVFVCPHAVIRAKIYEPQHLDGAPPTFKSMPYRSQEIKGHLYSLQVSPEDCTGCSLCVMVCPVKDKANPKHKAIDMAPQLPLREAERRNWEFFLTLPEFDRTRLKHDVKDTQFMTPLFEFSGACAGCGETPYIKLLTQLVGDRLLIANATGCSSIYGGNLPTTPYTTNHDGRGPAWSNSLFEDNAEFGLGMRLAVDMLAGQARDLVQRLAPQIGEELAAAVLNGDQLTEAGIARQRERVAALRARLAALEGPDARRLELLADYLVRKSVWIIGGDGWAYDIGYGGLDHVLAMGRDVKILVLDTEVYSNTGGQQSKATPRGAAAKFASAGKATQKKDLAALAMTYGNVYVARVAFGAKDAHTVRAFQEADAYPGTALIIAYCPCIMHGYDLAFGAEQQKLAVESGYWPLLRYDPRRLAEGKPALQLDSGPPKVDLAKFTYNEVRFRMVEGMDRQRARELLEMARRDVLARYRAYEQLAQTPVAAPTSASGAVATPAPAAASAMAPADAAGT
ncbi:MAG: pyruvate:ferredoxin (flavodoxin) oxidoreductase [Armatimonadota bacterium]|nr:pyruvate:ferredoxin (flavodoxin) oxidoreductase [Armatimonadota bacterium]MDR7548732.1 pyruvate:ferredoxin (flavodoxin) oxidoreductase [Armatimonadota bacterium]